MDSTIPAFWKVARMPEAAPRASGGTFDMMMEVFGAANRPPPSPLRRTRKAKSGLPKSVGSTSSPANEAAITMNPETANGRAPIRAKRGE
ncbi:hypothetical protein [Streptomyces mirabilis]|uniref:hypothetical protein n=1 Tax=Streptomyces mirabilis TaxID=68239 RepID=UPI0036A61486